MRVQYTLPGLQPQQLKQPEIEATPASFRSRVRRLSQALPRGWRHVLHLDVTPIGLEFLGPPPPADDMEALDAETRRRRWRELLDRQTRFYEERGASEEESEADQRTRRMLTLLLNYQMLEDAVASRLLAESQG
jgi:hypothetical protein